MYGCATRVMYELLRVSNLKKSILNLSTVINEKCFSKAFFLLLEEKYQTKNRLALYKVLIVLEENRSVLQEPLLLKKKEGVIYTLYKHSCKCYNHQWDCSIVYSGDGLFYRKVVFLLYNCSMHSNLPPKEISMI